MWSGYNRSEEKIPVLSTVQLPVSQTVLNSITIVMSSYSVKLRSE